LVVLSAVLSNPPEALRHLSTGAPPPDEDDGSSPTLKRALTARQVQQIQRRLPVKTIMTLVRAYQAGSSVNELAKRFNIHRVTVRSHLEHNGVPRRANQRKLSDEQVAEAAQLYRGGWSLAKLGQRFDVHAETVRRELRSAGVERRPRR
jgi:DNA-directed RNA polymerase specialized sigma24 family protein